MRIAVYLIIVIVILTSTVAIFYNNYYVIPRKRYDDRYWWSKASKSEQLKLCHVLIDRNLDGHDVFLDLKYLGNKETVPRLIQHFEKAGSIMENGGSCVANHCLDALISITGYDAGKTADDWKRWWASTGSKMPSHLFYPRAIKADIDGAYTGQSQ